MAPISSRVRSNTIAWLPSSKWRISSIMAVGRPVIQAMPSPTETTLPCSSTRSRG